MQATHKNWRADLRPGAIVCFAFPSKEGEAALEKSRPCLIIDVNAATGEATVAYGTGAWTSANVGLEIRVTRQDDLAAASLHKKTRFVCARRVRVPMTSLRFVEGGSGTAVLGHLPERLMPQLDDIRRSVIPVTIERRKRRIPTRRPTARGWIASTNPGRDPRLGGSVPRQSELSLRNDTCGSRTPRPVQAAPSGRADD